MAQTLRSKAIQDVLEEHLVQGVIGGGVSCLCGFVTGMVTDRRKASLGHVAEQIDKRLTELREVFSDPVSGPDSHEWLGHDR